jgi:hypothetical protein
VRQLNVVLHPLVRRPLMAIVVILTGGLGIGAGCSPGWRPVATAPVPSFDERTTIRFHTDTGYVTLHAVRIADDTLSGIPWTQHTSCDSCRLRYPMARISGLETGDPGASSWWILGPFLGLVAFGLYLSSVLPKT